MFIKLLITTIILLGLIVVSISLRLFFQTDSGLNRSSCAVLKGFDSDEKEACSSCAIKQLTISGE